MAGHSSADRDATAVKKSSRFRREARALGLHVRQLRHERGWTLEKAAEHAQLDLKHLQKIEAGQLNLTLVTLARIAWGFGVPIAALFATSEQPAAKKRR